MCMLPVKRAGCVCRPVGMLSKISLGVDVAEALELTTERGGRCCCCSWFLKCNDGGLTTGQISVCLKLRVTSSRPVSREGTRMHG